MTFSKNCVSTSKSDDISLKNALYFNENLKRLQYYNARCTTKQLIDSSHWGVKIFSTKNDFLLLTHVLFSTKYDKIVFSFHLKIIEFFLH